VIVTVHNNSNEEIGRTTSHDVEVDPSRLIVTVRAHVRVSKRGRHEATHAKLWRSDGSRAATLEMLPEMVHRGDYFNLTMNINITP
jgi:hypothetical protein